MVEVTQGSRSDLESDTARLRYWLDLRMYRFSISPTLGISGV